MSDVTYDDLRADEARLEGRRSYPDPRPKTYWETETEPGVSAYPPHDQNYWQDKVIKWQEECDRMFRQFDDSVAAHFPQHMGPGCKGCPVAPPMPPRPERPFERL